jgi:GDP-L-fucose synthase
MTTFDLSPDERVIVTGAGGVLGTAISSLLRTLPHKSALFLQRGDCDLLEKHSTEKLWHEFRPTLVFHLAGRVAGIQGNLAFGGEAFYENMLMGLNVVEASRQAGVRKVVAAGTAAIYSDQVPLPMREADLWNGAPHGSEGPYGHAKRALLAHLEAYKQQYGMEYAYLICTNLYGANDRFDTKNGHVVPSLVARFYEAVQDNHPSITIWGDGTPTRDFLYSEDAAQGFLAAAGAPAGAYNLASGTVVSIRQLVEILVTISGFLGDVLWDVKKPKGQMRRDYDISAITAQRWRAGITLEEGVRRTWRWYAENHAHARR